MDPELCDVVRRIRTFYPQPADFERLRQAVRQTEAVAQAVGVGESGIEEAMVSAWLALLYHEAHGLHSALDVLDQRYCRGGT